MLEEEVEARGGVTDESDRPRVAHRRRSAREPHVRPAPAADVGDRREESAALAALQGQGRQIREIWESPRARDAAPGALGATLPRGASSDGAPWRRCTSPGAPSRSRPRGRLSEARLELFPQRRACVKKKAPGHVRKRFVRGLCTGGGARGRGRRRFRKSRRKWSVILDSAPRSNSSCGSFVPHLRDISGTRDTTDPCRVPPLLKRMCIPTLSRKWLISFQTEPGAFPARMHPSAPE